ncbi:iron export ABC transporter permease subunit FetB [bacterium]|nr:iron export ABC transporter permease subunit FetB [bacterium]
MNNLVSLTPFDLSMASLLVLLLAGCSFIYKLDVEKTIIIAMLRTIIQLALVGWVLKVVFEQANIIWVATISLIMLLAAGREVVARQKHPLKAGWGFGISTSALFISSFAMTLFSLLVMINADPWYTPQYAIPLLGMMLGNTMTGIAVGIDQLTKSTIQQKAHIEQQLMLGIDKHEAILPIAKEAARTGLMPIINAMAAAGIVSLPGMMTGQILAGTEPLEAVKYQIMIMLLVSAGTGLGTLLAIKLSARRLFDDRHRLRLDRLSTP